MIRVLLGLILTAVGVGLVTGGTIAALAFGTAGELNIASPTVESDKDAQAMLLDIKNVDAGFPVSDALGEIRIGARSAEFAGAFIGIAATAEVDKYLTGVPYDVIHHVGGTWDVQSVPGTNSAGAPKEQTFWKRSSTGSNPTVQFVPAPGPSTSLVVMNADGRSGIKTQITVAYQSAIIFPMAVAAIVIGAILILLVIWLTIRGRRKRNAQKAAKPSASMPTITLPPSVDGARDDGESSPQSGSETASGQDGANLDVEGPEAKSGSEKVSAETGSAAAAEGKSQ